MIGCILIESTHGPRRFTVVIGHESHFSPFVWGGGNYTVSYDGKTVTVTRTISRTTYPEQSTRVYERIDRKLGHAPCNSAIASIMDTAGSTPVSYTESTETTTWTIEYGHRYDLGCGMFVTLTLTPKGTHAGATTITEVQKVGGLDKKQQKSLNRCARRRSVTIFEQKHPGIGIDDHRHPDYYSGLAGGGSVGAMWCENSSDDE